MDSPPPVEPKFLKLIACEIAVRELCHVTARSRNLIEPEFLTQGYHDTPNIGRVELQKRIDAVPEGKFHAILIGYGLCSNILAGLTTAHTPLVIPRAHDCITFFLGSKERYQEMFDQNPGTFYYTSGWLECSQRRRLDPTLMSLPAGSQTGGTPTYDRWVKKYGLEKAKVLLEAMGEWTASYNKGNLIDFSFTEALKLREQVQRICAQRGWEFAETAGDIGLFQRFVDADWREEEVLVVQPGERVVPAYDKRIITTETVAAAPLGP